MAKCQFLIKKRQNVKRESGSVLIEAVICLPFLIFLFLGLYDLSRVCEAYLAMNQVVREVMLTASRVNPTPDGTFSSAGMMAVENDPCNVNFDQDGCIIRAANWRAHILIKTKSIPVDPNSIVVTLTYDRSTTTVVTKIQAKFRSNFHILSFINLSTTASAFVTRT